ncbi:het-6-heterokaryon incompatibility protein, partial [Cladorrhinum sp. PSN332]
RRVFVTELGYIGLAPIASMLGDEVCVLMGSKVPHVIRRDGDIYRFVGECYVYGIMDGEVLQGIDVDDV